MLYHGPVRVPADAHPGNAIIRIDFPEHSTFNCVPTDIAVELVNKAKNGYARDISMVRPRP